MCTFYDTLSCCSFEKIRIKILIIKEFKFMVQLLFMIIYKIKNQEL